MIKPESGRLVGESHELEKQEEPTSYFEFNNKARGGKVIAFLRDNGTTNAIWPVCERLVKSAGMRLTVFADGSGKEKLESSSFSDSEPELGNNLDLLVVLANQIKDADVVLVGHSGDPGDLSLVATSKTYGVTSIGIQDYPGYLLGQSMAKASQNPDLIPDYVCVPDRWSYQRTIEAWPNISNRVVITGSPAFDGLADRSVRISEYNSFREKYHILPDEKAIVWVGGDTETNPDTFRLLLGALQELESDNKKLKLIVRCHSKDRISPSEYNALAYSLGLQSMLVDTSQSTMDIVRQGADLLVSVISTEMLKASYQGILSMAICLPETLVKDGHAEDRFSFMEDGTVSVTRKREDITDQLKMVLFDANYQNILRREMGELVTDGHATDRVVDLVQNIISKRVSFTP